MNQRYVIKVAGAAGQGVKSAGLILAKSLKAAGFSTFGYTEYPSLIKGGHNVFQIEVNDSSFGSISHGLDILLALNDNAIKVHAPEFNPNTVVIYDDGIYTLSADLEKELKNKSVTILPLHLLNLAKTAGGSGLMKNTVLLGAAWKVFGLKLNILNNIIGTVLNKTKEMTELNQKCAQSGYDAVSASKESLVQKFTPNPKTQSQLIITGNDAIGLGAIAAGVRLYSSYPMTPASSILSFLAEEGTKYGMVIKQAEDEITAANMVIGAYYAGTRAMCGTSGGGFDLMTEAVSLAGMTETPFVAVLGQRPGPATGLPTWTAQGDLNLALNCGHGEFARILLAPGDMNEAFSLTIEAHNLAEMYQTPVIILSDKMLGESYYSVPGFDLSKTTVNRGRLLKSKDFAANQDKQRYEITTDGISTRWLPGDDVNTFVANSDEHTPKGYSTEDASASAAMYHKRLVKEKTISANLPDPNIYGDSDNADISIISWGSNKQTILDAIALLTEGKIKCDFLHITHLWPLKKEPIQQFIQKAKKLIVIETNHQGQLAELIKQQTGINIEHRLLKYDGRPFYIEEIFEAIKQSSNATNVQQ